MANQMYGSVRDILRFEGSDTLAYWRRFSILLALAVVIATMGLLRNSGAVIIAAMLVAPLMTPILGIASSIVMGWVGRASKLLLTVWLAAGLSVLLAWVLVWLTDVPRGIVIPSEVISRTDPGAEDLVIALAAGIAGAYVQIRKSEASLIPGAAIGVSLVPPLAAAGILLYFGQLSRCYEALLLFATNFGAIILSACIVYLVLGPRDLLFRAGTRRIKFTLGFVTIAAFLAIVFSQLFTATYFRFMEAGVQAKLSRRIVEWATPTPIEILRIDIDAHKKVAEVWVVVDLPSDAQYKVASISDLLPPALKEVPFRDAARDVLGPEYKVIVRYQTRLAWLVNLKSQAIEPAPSTQPEGVCML